MKNKIDTQKYIPIVLCAGFGTRLKPLTNYLPKVICPIIHTPVAFLSIEIFFKAGFDKVHCNTHYMEREVREELIQTALSNGYDPSRIVFWYENAILETGGGIASIYHSLKNENNENTHKDFIVVSGDIAADFPLELMIKKWESRETEDYALLCTKELSYFRKDATWVTPNLKNILGFGESFHSQKEKIARLFSNHQIISHKILLNSPIEKASSIDHFYRKLLSNNRKIIHLEYPAENYWFDIGTPEDYMECIKFFHKKEKNNLENNILNYSQLIPRSLKEKISLFIEKNPKFIFNNMDISNNIIICFKQSLEVKHDIIIPLNQLEINSIETSSNKFLILLEKSIK